MRTEAKSELFRGLPSVDELLHAPDFAPLVAEHGSTVVTDAIRSVLARLREQISSGLLDRDSLRLALGGLRSAIDAQLRNTLAYSLQPVINATGVILHTNLGRAPLAEQALAHVREAAIAYSNLEFDIDADDRGKRDVHVDRLFRKLLGGMGPRVPTTTGHVETAASAVPLGRSPAELSSGTSTIVVNNNAAAVLLALNTLAEGGEVIVSRGELVEIGGSFRIPDVMAKSNARLREVGTTNRTRIADYERAITAETRLLLRVHRSNFEITGFTEQPELDELVRLAQDRKIPLMEDLGSGALFDLRSVGVSGEPSVVDSLRAGVDVVTYSGDKLLGGPQAGMLSGRAGLIAKMRSNSLFRALRVDKLTYAALEATLMAYVKGDHDAVPTIRMMRLSKESITKRVKAVAQPLQNTRLSIEVIDGESLIGGGSAPSAVLPTSLLAITRDGLSADETAAKLRSFDPPIIARVETGRVLLDLRTVFPEQDPVIISALRQIAE
jgi:L-seryl-tRNA(Ser) seleniumtransferase